MEQQNKHTYIDFWGTTRLLILKYVLDSIIIFNVIEFKVNKVFRLHFVFVSRRFSEIELCMSAPIYIIIILPRPRVSSCTIAVTYRRRHIRCKFHCCCSLFCCRLLFSVLFCLRSICTGHIRLAALLAFHLFKHPFNLSICPDYTDIRVTTNHRFWMKRSQLIRIAFYFKIVHTNVSLLWLDILH